MSNDKEFKELEKWLKDEAEDLQEVLYEAVKHYTTEMAKQAKLLCPVKTGYLKRSISYRFYQNGEYYTGEVEVGADYGIYVEFGTPFQDGKFFLNTAFNKQSQKFYDELISLMRRHKAI